jgi:HlyD family secretion protein
MIREPDAMDRPIDRPTLARRLLVPVLGGAGVLVLVLLMWPAISRWTAADRSVSRAQLRFGTVERGDLEHTVAVQGRVVAASRPTLYSPADGIASLRVREGETVAAGELLVEVESPELESRLRQERAGLDARSSDLRRLELETRQRDLQNAQDVELAEVRSEAASRLLERNRRLFELGLVNEIDLETSVDALEIARLELEQARQRLDLEREMHAFEVQDARLRRDRQRLVVEELERQVQELQLVSPFDGLVATLSVDDRDAVIRGQAIVGVVDLTDLEVEVGIPEAAADEVVPGVQAVVSVDGVEHDGTLTRIAPEVLSGQVLGRVVFDGGVPEGLRQNQRVATRIVLDRRRGVLIVPRGPFLESGGGRSVYVVDDGLARRISIEVGAVSVAQVEIVEGLAEGDEIVLSDMTRFEGADAVLLRN